MIKLGVEEAAKKMLEEVQKKDARLQEVGCMNY